MGIGTLRRHYEAQGSDPVPEWPLKTPPEEYLEQKPDGPNAELARRVLAARE